MEAAVKTLRVMPNALRRPTTYVNSEPVRVLDEDAIFASMFDNETIDFNEILDFLRRKTTPTRILDDAFFIALTQDILDGKPPTISRKEVLQAIAFGSVSDEVVEDMEDALLLKMMAEVKEDGDDESVSEEESAKRAFPTVSGLAFTA